MHEHNFAEEQHDLNEIMSAFGVHEWNNLGPADSAHTRLFSLLVEIQGQRYILKERPQGLIEEDSDHGVGQGREQSPSWQPFSKQGE